MPRSIHEIQTIINEKVIGKIFPDHDEWGHHYILPNYKRVDSVTQKIITEKPHLIKWAVKMGFEWMEAENRFSRLSPINRDEFLQGATLAHTDIRDSAGQIGSTAHQIIDDYIKDWMKFGTQPLSVSTADPTRDYQVIACVRGAIRAMNHYKMLPVASEIIVGSEKHNCAGSLDALMMSPKGHLELWDWKSSNNVQDEYSMQVAAYKYFFEEMTGLRVKTCRIIKLDKSSDKFKVYNVTHPAKAFRAWRAIASVYDWRESIEAKLLEDKVRVKI